MAKRKLKAKAQILPIIRFKRRFVGRRSPTKLMRLCKGRQTKESKKPLLRFSTEEQLVLNQG
jgi:hypothetical protein